MWVLYIAYDRLRWQWGDLLHMCAHDAICCPLGNKFGVKVPSAARWRNANEEQNRKLSIKMFTRMDSLWVWLMDCVDRGQDLEVIHVYYREHFAKDLSMSISADEMGWKSVHLMLECRENLGLPFSNNHLPAVFTLTFGAEATIWWHHVGE